MTKRLSLCISLFLLLSLSLPAQKRTTMATLYRQFKPSTITLKDGRTLKQSLTNVFLKNSSLLYLKGDYTMEANMENIVAVEFDDRSFINLNGQLAFLVDSVGKNRLFCVELFDQESYERNLRNNVNLSNINFGADQLSTASIDLNNEEDYKFPVFQHFYYQIDGTFVKVHERELARRLNKEQRTMMKRIIALPDFSWQKPESLLTLLKAIGQ